MKYSTNEWVDDVEVMRRLIARFYIPLDSISIQVLLHKLEKMNFFFLKRCIDPTKATNEANGNVDANEFFIRIS